MKMAKKTKTPEYIPFGVEFDHACFYARCHLHPGWDKKTENGKVPGIIVTDGEVYAAALRHGVKGKFVRIVKF